MLINQDNPGYMSDLVTLQLGTYHCSSTFFHIHKDSQDFIVWLGRDCVLSGHHIYQVHKNLSYKICSHFTRFGLW